MNEQALSSLSFGNRVWKVCSPDKKVITNIDNLVEQLLKSRGVKTEKEKKQFFNPELTEYEREFDLPHIEIAKKRILQAVEKKELIDGYGDYDVDGLCATAILYHGLTALGANVLPYIPHREKEGYGLSKIGLEAAKEKGASLVITVDNGIVALEQSKFAKQLGLDLIITDHHVPLEGKLPQALAIVHSTSLSGAAVGWCLVRAMISETESLELLDLVAMATLCDLISLVGVNRVLTKEGLKKLNVTKRAGLLELITQSGLELGKIGAYEVGHVLGPRLNALGRLEHSIDALRLLCTKEKERAKILAKLLCDSNDQKKKIALDAILEAKQKVAEILEGKKILFLSSERWVPGIIGLVAGRICEEYKLPAIAISKGEIYSKGSARSVNGLNIVETIRQCGDLLLDVGGHPGAAGFTIETAKIEVLEKRLIEVMESVIVDQTSELEVEALISPENLTKEWVSELEKLEPFGVGNPKPIFACINSVISNISTVGEGKHLRFKYGGIDAIAFSFGSLVNEIKEGQKIDAAFYLEINRFNGSEKLQFKVVDIRL